MISIVKTRKVWYSAAVVYLFIAIAAIFWYGFKPGLDFTGGALLEVDFSQNRPSTSVVYEALKPMDLGTIVAQPADEQAMLVRLPFLSVEQHQEVLNRLDELNGTAPIVETRYETIGPSVSSELKSKSISAIILVILGIMVYITWTFRKVSKPIPSWNYGLIVVVALVHDVIVPAGVMAVLGHFLGYEIDTLFVVALLTILAFSVNDTIVTFDRIRENLVRAPQPDFADTVDNSINETITRSLATSFAVLLTMFAVYFFGGETVEHFMLIMIVGMIAGTYSSIFLASPMLVDLARRMDVHKLVPKK
ncbi:MAG: protein translocase subunit SecF [Patescibacteria group bacterium]